MGLTGLLNVAKNGLVTHQTSLQTIGHNISNVNTRGYSRQDTITRAMTPTPMYAGFIGNGVGATEILRDYDQFITKTLFEKTSDMSGLDTRQSGMKLVEGVLNEVDENGLNQLINQFWTAWDDIANMAEGMPERTTLLQRAELLVKEIGGKYQQLVQISKNVDINIDTDIKSINSLAKQVAEINVQIVSGEAGHHSANDLRDQRDMLIKRMSELADINYFETQRGSYTVLIGQGSPLVDGPESWSLEMRSGSIYWTGGAGQEVELTTKDLKGGDLGGWMDLKSRVTPRDPTVLTGSVPNASGGRAMRSSTRWDAIDGVTVTGDFNIVFSGTDQNGNPVGPVTFSYTQATDTNPQVQDFLDAIEAAFPNVEASVTDDGRIRIKDLVPGDVPVSFQIEDINGNITGLDLGKFDGDYPLNYTEQLNKWASELIKAVNGVHSQGAGLIPLQETTSEYGVISTSRAISSRASGLAFSDMVQDGSFEIYLYDSNGNVIDANPGTDINEPYTISVTTGVTTLEDIRDDINSTIPDINARIVNNKLVIGLDGPPAAAAGFAFGRDTSGALTALGINSFFTGENAATIGLNSTLVEDPRLIAAAQVEHYGAATALSNVSVMDENRVIDAQVINGTVRIDLLDSSGNTVDTRSITINRTANSLDDILEQMNSIDGVHAWIENDLVHVEAETNGYQVAIDDSAGGTDTGLLEFLGMSGAAAQSIDGTLKVERSFDVLSSYDTSVTTGAAFSIDIMDENGNLLNPPAPPSVTVTINAGDTLSDIAAAIDAQNNISAQVVNGRLRISAEGQGELFYFRADNTGLMDYLQISTPAGGTLSPANNMNALELRDLNGHTVKELDGATLNEFYQGLVGTVGIHSKGFQLDYDFSRASVDELETRRDDVSGVSLDEEMSDLIKFQHAYTAAAKLIKAADEMFLSLLQAK